MFQSLLTTYTVHYSGVTLAYCAPWPQYSNPLVYMWMTSIALLGVFLFPIYAFTSVKGSISKYLHHVITAVQTALSALQVVQGLMLYHWFTLVLFQLTRMIPVETKQELDKVLQGAKKVVVVDFFATWCGPCVCVAPKIEAMSKSDEFKHEVEFVKIDVDNSSDIAEHYAIHAMPTFIIFKEGEKVEELVGANDGKVKAVVNKVLNAMKEEKKKRKAD